MNPRDEILQLAQSLRSRWEEDRYFSLSPGKRTQKTPDRQTSPGKAVVQTPSEKNREAPSEPVVLPHTASLFERKSPTAKRLSREEKVALLEEIDQEVRSCRRCRLCETRNKAVPGEGNPETRILFVGEGPGANEDEQGRPFVGRAGKLLTDIIEKGMGMSRNDVFITNIVKCRPPENREPRPDEVASCIGFLKRQMEILNPEITVPLGRPATTTLLETQASMSKMRGKIHRFLGRKIIPTFHPAYLLRNPPEKKRTWEDIQLVMKELGISTRRGST